jgi:hypothetical protein
LVENQISFESCLLVENGRPKGSRALTLLASTGERMSFYEAARQYDQEALRVIASVFMDEKQPAALRLAAANDLLDRAYGKPPHAVVGTQPRRQILQVRWLPPDPMTDRGTSSRNLTDGHSAAVAFDFMALWSRLCPLCVARIAVGSLPPLREPV